MFILTIENQNKEKLVLTQNETTYQVLNVEGLTPPDSEITTVQLANMDGEKYKSSRLQMRNIVITLRLNGNVEQNRIALYNYFRVGKYCKIYYSNETRNIYAEGYCETIESELFSIGQEMQISIICPDAYLHDLNKIVNDISKTSGNFRFPFAIDSEGIAFSEYQELRISDVINYGEFESGIKITLTAEVDNIQNPIIYNSDTGKWLKLDITLNVGDKVIIDTTKGKKSIVKIIDGVKSNGILHLATSSTWLQLETGINHFIYNADTNVQGLFIIFETESLYEGI